MSEEGNGWASTPPLRYRPKAADPAPWQPPDTPGVATCSSGLGNPVTVLYREVMNEQASWTDALFWFLMGAFSTAGVFYGLG